LRYCDGKECKELITDTGCCNNNTDCLGTAIVYYFTSGLYTDSIQSKTSSGELVIEEVSFNDGQIRVPGNFYAYGPGLFNNTISVDTISQYTAGHGVIIETITLKAGNLTVPGSFSVGSFTSDSISAKTTNGDLTLAGDGTGTVVSSSTFKVNTISARTGSAISVSSVTLDTGTITASSTVTAGEIISDTVTARSTNTDLTLAGAGTGTVISSSTFKTNAITARTGTSITFAGTTVDSGGILFANTGASVSSYLSYYEEFSFSATVSGLWGATTYSATMNVVRIGTQVTVSWQAIRNTATCSSGAYVSSDASLPARYRPSTIKYFTTIIEDSGTILSGLATLSSGGVFTWYNGNLPTSGTYTCGTTGTSGFMSSSFTYVYNQ
jgi:hypothetical protein